MKLHQITIKMGLKSNSLVYSISQYEKVVIVHCIYLKPMVHLQRWDKITNLTEHCIEKGKDHGTDTVS
jgi:hypothetical protein